jgi:predicted small secreted protein
MMTKSWVRRVGIVLLIACCLMLTGCSGNVGVGMSVGVPVGSSGHMRIGGSTWL